VRAQDHTLQAQRYELKYLIEEEQALRIRDWVKSYLEVDEYGEGKPDYSYAIHSIYLDSSDLKLYHGTINGDKNRFKLRVRFYNDDPEAPIFFEIKRRMNNVIAKERCAVRPSAVQRLLSAHFPEPGDLLSNAPGQLVSLQRFCRLMSGLDARSRSHVAYLREAWVSPHDNSIRVTMDRNIRTEVAPVARLNTRMSHPKLVFGKQVVLELKFTGRFPDWFGDLVRFFGLMQCGAAKYAEGITLMGCDVVCRAYEYDEYYVAAQERKEVINGHAQPSSATGTGIVTPKPALAN